MPDDTIQILPILYWTLSSILYRYYICTVSVQYSNICSPECSHRNSSENASIAARAFVPFLISNKQALGNSAIPLGHLETVLSR